MFSICAVIPTYNRAHVLSRALDSIAQQLHPPEEIIVVDDGSTDGTAGLLEQWIQRNAKAMGSKGTAFSVIQQDNAGVSSARNTAIHQANSNWIALLDSDDEWLPNRLQLQCEMAQAHPHLQLIHGEEVWIRNGVRVNAMKKHKKSGGHIYQNCLPLCCISPSASLIKKDLLIKHGGFDENFPVCEDYDLWLKICAENEVGFVETPIVKKYGGHEDQLSRKFVAMDYWRIRSLFRQLHNPNLPGELKIPTAETLIKKATILLKGYQKHNNMDSYDEVSDWSSTASKILDALN